MHSFIMYTIPFFTFMGLKRRKFEIWLTIWLLYFQSAGGAPCPPQTPVNCITPMLFFLTISGQFILLIAYMVYRWVMTVVMETISGVKILTKGNSTKIQKEDGCPNINWCLTPLSTIFQCYTCRWFLNFVFDLYTQKYLISSN